MSIDTSVALMNASYQPKPLQERNDVLLKEQTDQFEAYFVKQILDISMKNESGLLPKDAGDKIYKSMYNDTMSSALSGNLGLSQMLFEFLKEGR
jgi:Rod binding domain-containing protein